MVCTVGCEAGSATGRRSIAVLGRTPFACRLGGVVGIFNALEKSGAFLFSGILFGLSSVRIRHHHLRNSLGLKRPSAIFSGEGGTGMVESRLHLISIS